MPLYQQCSPLMLRELFLWWYWVSSKWQIKLGVVSVALCIWEMLINNMKKTGNIHYEENGPQTAPLWHTRRKIKRFRCWLMNDHMLLSISIKQLCVCFGSCYHESTFFSEPGLVKWRPSVASSDVSSKWISTGKLPLWMARLFWKAKKISFHVRSVSLILLRWVLHPNFRVLGDAYYRASRIFDWSSTVVCFSQNRSHVPTPMQKYNGILIYAHF